MTNFVFSAEILVFSEKTVYNMLLESGGRAKNRRLLAGLGTASQVFSRSLKCKPIRRCLP